MSGISGCWSYATASLLNFLPLPWGFWVSQLVEILMAASLCCVILQSHCLPMRSWQAGLKALANWLMLAKLISLPVKFKVLSQYLGETHLQGCLNWERWKTNCILYQNPLFLTVLMDTDCLCCLSTQAHSVTISVAAVLASHADSLPFWGSSLYFCSFHKAEYPRCCSVNFSIENAQLALAHAFYTKWMGRL